MPTDPLLPTLPLPDDLDRLPTQDVAAFVEALIAHSGLVVRRTRLDDFADAVTRMAGDEVYSDRTLDQLVALARARRITGRQLAKMTLLHVREVKARREASDRRRLSDASGGPASAPPSEIPPPETPSPMD